jgi:hypothetical protein
MKIKKILSAFRSQISFNQPVYHRFSDAQIGVIYERTSRTLKLLRRRWRDRLWEEDEIEIILHLDKLRKRLERKALVARLNSEFQAEQKILDMASEVAVAANSCCICQPVEDGYPKASDV